MMPARKELALVVKRQSTECHRRLLIATDLDDTSVALPIHRYLDNRARIAVLGAYRIPFCGLHTLFAAPRLERELAARTHASMLAFIRSTGLATGRFELLTCNGDLRDHVVREALSRGSDLVVLALSGGSHRGRQRVAARLLDETACDLVIVHGDCATTRWLDGEALVAFGPWAC